MADISLCKFKECPKSKECYRFMAIPDKWQSYMEFKNICKEQNDYKWFWAIGGKTIRKEELPESEENDLEGATDGY